MFDLLDGLLLVAIVLFGISGYRQGFLVGALSFVGFLGGAVVGARLAPGFAEFFSEGGSPALGLVVVFAGACLGQLVAAAVAAGVREHITWRPAQTVDAIGGALVSGLSVLLVAWLLASAVNRSPYEALRQQVNNSRIIISVDTLIPDGVRAFFAGFLRLVEEQGFPEVFAGIGTERIVPVPEPDPALAASPVVQRVRPSVLKIRGSAECDREIEGSGFVFAPERVMTNAHVVAGVDDPVVEVGNARLDAEVVVFDPDRDVAVLHVPGLGRPALPLSPEPAGPGDSALVVGYPQDGPFTARAARVRNVINARGENIYSTDTVVREVYAVRSIVLPGNSGGPLVDPEGEVLGVVFAAALDGPETGYVLTVDEVSSAIAAGRAATVPVDTGGCD